MTRDSRDHSHDDCQYALERCDRLERNRFQKTHFRKRKWLFETGLSCHDGLKNMTNLGCDSWDASLPEISNYDERERKCKQYYGEARHSQCRTIYSNLFWQKELMRAYFGPCEVSLPWFRRLATRVCNFLSAKVETMTEVGQSKSKKNATSSGKKFLRIRVSSQKFTT